jgi:hypothetical protein
MRYLLFILTLFLVACSSEHPGATAVSDNPDYSLTVAITPNDTPAELEARYGGKVVIWQPQDGYAVLGLDSSSDLYASATLEPNKDVFMAGVRLSWMNGSVSAWAGGSVSAWAGGSVSAWAGGSVSAWAG